MVENFTDNQKNVLEVIDTKLVENFKRSKFNSYSTRDSSAWFRQLDSHIRRTMDSHALTPEEKANPEFRIALMEVVMKLLIEKAEIGNMHRTT